MGCQCSTRKKWEINVTSLAAKKPKESSTLTAETLVLQEAVKGPNLIKTMFLGNLNVDAQNQIFRIKCVTGRMSLHAAVYSTKTLTEKQSKIELCAI